jgi:hypothetical protein
MLPATLLWNEAVNWMVIGEVFNGDPYLRMALNGQEERLSADDAEAALRDRLESGEAIAAGRRCVRYDPSAGETDAVPREIPVPEWPALRIDYATSFAEAVNARIPGQGYVDVRLKRADVIAAYEVAIARKLAEQECLARALLGTAEPQASSLFALGGIDAEPPTPRGAEAAPPNIGKSSVQRAGRRSKPPGATIGELRLALLEQGLSMEKIAEMHDQDIDTIRRSLDRGRERRALLSGQ